MNFRKFCRSFYILKQVDCKVSSRKLIKLKGINKALPTAWDLRICNPEAFLSGPCKNGGTCSVQGSSFSCECYPGYYPPDCSGSVCNAGNCQNGGTCHVDSTGSGSYFCSCRQIWNLPSYYNSLVILISDASVHHTSVTKTRHFADVSLRQKGHSFTALKNVSYPSRHLADAWLGKMWNFFKCSHWLNASLSRIF